MRLIFLLLIVFATSTFSEEVITRFHSEIEVNESGVLDIKEHISVIAEGKKIRRGIYRDFPTQYLGPMLTKKKVPFEILEVKRNGSYSAFHTENLHNGIRIYIGSSAETLPRGAHDYMIHYQTEDQLGHFDEYDELYWNVTGTGWSFPILKASAEVKLPNNGHDLVTDQQLWTGYQGESSQNGQVGMKEGKLTFETNRSLEPYQGLTVGLAVPKGVFLPPKKDPWKFIASNLPWLITVLLFLGYLTFYLRAWYLYGRDPKSGVIIPIFTPPRGLSPAASRYLDRQYIDEKNLSSALVSLASKGYINIYQSDEGYEFSKNSASKLPKLSNGESAVMKKLFGTRSKKLRIKKKYNSKISQAKSALSAQIKIEYKDKCFVDNGASVGIGWLISAVLSYFYLYTWVGHMVGGFELLAMIVIGFVFAAIGITFLIAFPWIWLIILVSIYGSYSEILAGVQPYMPGVIFLVSILFINFLFMYLLRAPTPFGRKLKDQIDGLKLYIKTAELNRLNLLHPPEQNLNHYEQLLPYAVALGLENEWGERFHEQIQQAQMQEGGYQPSWYSGSGFDTGDFSTNMRSFSSQLSSTVSKAMTTPSSSGSSGGSSGSFSSGSGGGFSGGGGGGGGGGGW